MVSVWLTGSLKLARLVAVAAGGVRGCSPRWRTTMSDDKRWQREFTSLMEQLEQGAAENRAKREDLLARLRAGDALHNEAADALEQAWKQMAFTVKRLSKASWPPLL
jgi:hypothetical protein